MATHFVPELDRIDGLIREGNFRGAQARLRELTEGKLPRRELLARIANLSLRAGVPQTSVRILNKVVRIKDKDSDATPEEKAEYAIALIKIGAVFEGLTLLEEIEPKRDPKILLYQTSGLFTRWEYAKAVPLLRKYLQATAADPYAHLVGQVNLVAALIFVDQYAEALALVDQSLALAEAKGATLLKGNCLELKSQILISQKKFPEAERALEIAAKHFGDSGGASGLYVKKWNAILSLDRDHEPAPLQNIRSEAVSAQNWETLRECDFYLGLDLRDSALLNYLYHGTPYEPYRERIRQKAGGTFEPTEEYLWEMGGKNSTRSFDLRRAEEIGSGVKLKPGMAHYRLFKALCSDFYRPFRPATLFSLIFPDELYHPLTSLARVYNLVVSFRSWLEESDIPLKVEENSGLYRIVANGPYGIRTVLDEKHLSGVHIGLQRLKDAVSDREFTASEAANATGTSKRSVLRVLNYGVEQGTLVKCGGGNKVKYRFK